MCKRPEIGAKETPFFIVALFSHEAIHTKHAMFLEGCLICRIWPLWSNIYPDFFFKDTIITLFCRSALFACLYLGLVSICGVVLLE